MGTQHLEGIVMRLHESERSKASACWQNTLFLVLWAVDPLEKWWGTMGCGADGWGEDGHLKGASNKAWSRCCTAEN